MPETRTSSDRLGKHRIGGAVSGTEGSGKGAPLGARLPPLARGWAECSESHGEHQRRLRGVEPGRRSGATVATDPAGLSDTGTVERSQPARAAVDWGRWREASNGGLYHWRLASFPIHYPWIVDAQTAMFREQLANHLEKFSRENMGALVRRPWDLRGIDHHEGALGTEDFLSLGTEMTAPTARRQPHRLARRRRPHPPAPSP